MLDNDFFWGVGPSEFLSNTPIKAVESFGLGLEDLVADGPIDVLEWVRKVVSHDDLSGRDFLDKLFYELDADFGCPSGTARVLPSPALYTLADEFANAIRTEYVPFACDPTGWFVVVNAERSSNGKLAFVVGDRKKVQAF